MTIKEKFQAFLGELNSLMQKYQVDIICEALSLRDPEDTELLMLLNPDSDPDSGLLVWADPVLDEKLKPLLADIQKLAPSEYDRLVQLMNDNGKYESQVDYCFDDDDMPF